jgi:hypothetical protein
LIKSFYLYLFIFASLIALVIYVNGRKYQEKLEDQVQSLRKELYETDQERKEALSTEVKADYENSVFSLKGNPESENYLDSMGLEASEVEALVRDQLLELNIKEGGNPLVPYIGQGRGFRINDTKFINHKWVLANFTDNDRWGDVVIRYDINEKKEVEMETIKALLFDKNTNN